ncbi:hypothetical protein H6P81_002717 [Aristolochia fimbriata]|uniref:Ubiquitin-like protease family profile domain-containing protein n=1 Tax=Aristolochia fimbriata TaxID=158543 RepID=A0AAV7FC81_ARIFI|nr:hypothetical protein H6P81_002717 [Aristolochia fimbriata]
MHVNSGGMVQRVSKVVGCQVHAMEPETSAEMQLVHGCRNPISMPNDFVQDTFEERFIQMETKHAHAMEELEQRLQVKFEEQLLRVECPRKRKVFFKFLSPPHVGTKRRKAGKWVRQLDVEKAKQVAACLKEEATYVATVGSEPRVPYNLLCDVLNDEFISGPVIEAYIDMLAARQESSPAGYRKCCFLSSWVHSFFTERAHEANKRSARNLEGFLGKITTIADLIFLPLNNEMHWHLLVVKVQRRRSSGTIQCPRQGQRDLMQWTWHQL